MKKITMKFAVLSVAAALTGGLAFAQTAAATDPSASASADKLFVMQADEGNSAEIAASQIALKKSKNADVKAYAKQMIDDHMKLRSDMGPLAAKLGVTTPQPLSPTHKAEDARLSQLSGDKFNKEYIKDMDQDHHKTLGMINNEIATTSNDEVKTAAQSAQTVVAQHTDAIDQLATKMGAPTATTPGQ